MTNHPTPQPSGRTAQEILDYADPNHPADFWRKQAAQRQLFDAICSEVIGGIEKHPKGCHNWLVGVCDRTVRNELRTEQRERLRLFFAQPEGSEIVYEDTNKRFLAQPPMFDLDDNQPEESRKDGDA